MRPREGLGDVRDDLAAIFRNVADGITVARPDGRLAFANEAAARLIGFESPEALLAATSEERLGRFELFDEERRPLSPEQLPGRQALRGLEGAERTVCWRTRDTGEERWSIVRASPILDAEGDVLLAVNVFHDVTERKLVEERSRFLVEASEALSSSLDFEATLATVAALAVPRFADRCEVLLLGPDGSLARLAAAPDEPAAPEPPGVAAAVASRTPSLEPGAIAVPLVARDRVLGAIAFASGARRRPYGPDDLAAARDLARSAAAAVDNALLFREAEDAGARARESLALVDTLFQTAPVGFAFFDRELRYIRVNDSLAAMNGVPAEALVGRPIFAVFPEFERQLGPVLREVLEEGATRLDLEVSGETPAAPGRTRYWRASFYPVRDEDGRVLGVGETISEVTSEREAQAAAEAARRRLEFLSEASRTLATTLDYRRTLQQVVRLAVPAVAESCSAYVVDDSGGVLARIAHAHVDPELESLLASAAPELDLERDARVPFVRAFRSGEAIHAPTLAPPAEGGEADRPHELLRRLGVRSLMVVPLVARGRTFGVVSFSSRTPGRHGEEDLDLARELARRMAIALDRASLYRAAQESFSRLSAVLRQLPLGVRIADARTGAVVLENEAVAEVWPAASGDAPRAFHLDGSPVEPEEWPLARSLATGETVLGEELGFERADGTRGTLEASSAPVRDDAGEIVAAVAIFSDVTERKRAESRLRFLARASELLSESLAYEETLQSIAALAVPTLAGQCIVDLLEEDGRRIRCVAAAHADPELTALLREVRETYPPVVPEHPVQVALRTGAPQYLPRLDEAAIRTMAHDERHADAIRTLANTSGIVVPLLARGRTLGAITLGTIPPQPPYTEADVELAEELARRAATAIDNALLYSASESRAHTAQALAFVDDGVLLADEAGIVRLWNPAAEAITGTLAADAVGVPVREVLPGWDALRGRIPVAPHPRPGVSSSHTLPLELEGQERWIAISGVRFPGGTVYAFRDVTEERAVERLKSDFVSTVSHELRTPLAAIYGAALTLRRTDVELDEGQRHGLLDVIANEADRLARIVNEILWASRLDAETTAVAIESCDAAALARQIVGAARHYAPAGIELALEIDGELPLVAADPDKIRQVLTNLLDNAVKYSPDGGRVALALETRDGRLRFRVSDEGLGVPAGEHERIFEKFYRLDPNLTRGVGGTGLGLYICRELVHRMDGSIWVESDGRSGSTFVVELPLAGGAR